MQRQSNPAQPTSLSTIAWWSLLVLAVAFTLIWSIWLNLQSSLRLDEAQSVWVVTKTIPGILAYIAKDVHVPLYFLLLHFWTQLFGTSELAIRSLSVLFLVLSIPAVYLLAREASTPKVALTTCCLFCLSPFLTWYGTEARMYTLLVLLSALSSLSFLRLYKTQVTQGRLAYIFWSVLGVYSHYFFMILVVLQLTYLLFTLWKEQQAANEKGLIVLWWPPLKRYLFCFLIIVVSLLPWIIFSMLQGGNSNNRPLLIMPNSYSILLLFVQLLTGFQPTTVENNLVSIWPLILIVLFLTFGRPRGSWFNHLFYFLLVAIGSTLIAVLISFTIQPILVARYLIFITPALFYLLALLLEHFNKVTYGVILALVFMSNVAFQYQQLTSPDVAERENYSAAAGYLNTIGTSQDIVVATSPFTVYPLEYYYRGGARIETIPEWNRYLIGSIPVYDEQKLIEQLESYRKSYQRMYVVLSYDQGYEEKVIHYLDNNLELKDTQVFSPGLQVRAYQLRYDSGLVKPNSVVESKRNDQKM